MWTFPTPLRFGLRGLGLAKSGLLAHNMQNLISNMMGILFLLSKAPSMENFRILGGLLTGYFRLGGIYRAGNLNSRQARQEICPNSGRSFLPGLPGVLLFMPPSLKYPVKRPT